MFKINGRKNMNINQNYININSISEKVDFKAKKHYCI